MRNLATSLLLSFLVASAGAAQTPEPARPIRFQKVLDQALQDPELKGYSMQTQLAELAPLASDTVDHRHGAEVFGYIVEGAIVTQVNNGARTTYSAGEMFYEPRGTLHGHFENPSAEKPARVLILFLIKEGRPGYTRERP
jgi:quercetin dioxygenase-like cupin family protein